MGKGRKALTYLKTLLNPFYQYCVPPHKSWLQGLMQFPFNPSWHKAHLPNPSSLSFRWDLNEGDPIG
ncbi:hypothetical protein KDI_33200 [Dictyobacter arantiisoli]|uniref:Uncharacterized protein n=1 Tax=Dictyobacter arantiisoli TaxID=2014874 RepID=A0A5A5TF34_9CHLR|nr:hypothetical protein KDI_33200 [Dictyobacter arantiisoli]